jgi:hypothetical protein
MIMEHVGENFFSIWSGVGVTSVLPGRKMVNSLFYKYFLKSVNVRIMNAITDEINATDLTAFSCWYVFLF